ncbi:DNA methyltransferase [Streptomyces sp. NPDC057654]|uniref:DNA methyltransferase n=1 Tax=Streptomyces sp. NPDC057654 TaxID=3346196 RepID=UPI00368795FD
MTDVPTVRDDGRAGRRSWQMIDGALESIDFPGPTDMRFPESLAEYVLENFSRPGDWVLDPFCGFGTTLAVAHRLGREAVGFERDDQRAAFARTRLPDPARLLTADAEHVGAEHVGAGPWPPFALLLTSPPFTSFRTSVGRDVRETHLDDARRIFASLTRFLAPGATVAVEVSQLRRPEWRRTRPLVWEFGMLLGELFQFSEDIVFVQTGPDHAAPGYHHTHVLVFRYEP